MTYLRNEKGRFRKSLFIPFGLVLVLVGGLTLGFIRESFASTVEYRTVEKFVEVDNLMPKIEDLKNELLDTLEKCEAGGFSEADAPIVMEPNGYVSIGTFQFAKRTVVHYYKVLYGQDITQKEAVEIAIDSAKARKLAHDIIFTSESGLKDWIVCERKHKLNSELAFIKKLQ